MLPPVAYLDNPINAVTTKFIHTSTNKIRFPVNVVRVSSLLRNNNIRLTISKLPITNY
jgi:hypothetical protein